MNRFALAALAAVFSFPAAADDWTGQDKRLHFAGSAVIASAVTVVSKSESAGFWTTVAVGVAKEAWDYKHRAQGHQASAKDLVADVAGAYVGAKLGGLVIQPKKGGADVSFTWKLN